MDFKPYSKEYQLRGHKKKEKDTPNFKEQRYKKKKKKSPLKQEVYKGRKIPTKQQRGKITTREYNEALRVHGETCYFCNSPNIEMHHVMPKGHSRLKNGRGVWRNLRALCPEHHRGEDGVHGKNGAEKMRELQELHESLYGKWFYMDRYDLFKLNLIPNTDSVTFETYMKGEEEKCQQTMSCGISGNEK